jgi:dCMP deaminase
VAEESYRPTWDQVWLKVALQIGPRSRCSRAQVGAVIVTHDNRVAALSYNGPPRGLEVSGSCDHWCPRAMGDAPIGADYSACDAIHAEANAITRADFTDIQNGTIYVTHSTCINCAQLVGNSGISRLVHRVTDADAHRNPEKVESYLRKIGIEVSRG